MTNIINSEEGFGRWCNEGGLYVEFRSKQGDLECRLYEIGADRKEIAKFTLADFRVLHLLQWYKERNPSKEPSDGTY